MMRRFVCDKASRIYGLDVVPGVPFDVEDSGPGSIGARLSRNPDFTEVGRAGVEGDRSGSGDGQSGEGASGGNKPVRKKKRRGRPPKNVAKPYVSPPDGPV